MPLLVGIRFPLNSASESGFQPFHPPDSIARLIGSSAFAAIADDTLKDEDNAGWVMQLEAPVQREWVERIRWIRVIDRLAESELGCDPATDFQAFVADWQRMQATGTVSNDSRFTSILQAMRDRWFDGQGQIQQPAAVHAWNHYVSATAVYNNPNLVIETCGDYEQLLTRLAGSFFQVLPFLADHHYSDACQFGIVDQFYNHLRDLQEDLTHGICYFPLEVLHQFGLSREDFCRDRVLQNPSYYKMMQFWLDVYLPRLRRRVRHLIAAKDLHPSWQILCEWSLHRYRRIEHVFRECEFDYTQFPHAYWKRVRSELPFMLDTVRNHQTEFGFPPAFAIQPNLLPSLRSPNGWTSCIALPIYSSAM